jgi:hypothetical protein
MTQLNKRLFIWVEGRDDERFFNAILKPRFEEEYGLVEVRPYANLRKEKLYNYIRSIQILEDDYIFVADIDTSPNVKSKKFDVQARVNNVAGDRIAVVIEEIESWYLAGLDTHCMPVNVGKFKATDKVTKEDFNALVPLEFDSRIDFMLEILKCFSVEQAERKNKSFLYFLNTFLGGNSPPAPSRLEGEGI